MSPAATKARVRTLVVEDQGMFRAFLLRWLDEQPAFVVVGATASAEEGLQLAEECRPELLLVDLHLPGMDGLDFVRAVRQGRPEVRSLILTSLTDPLAVTRIRESGVEGYLEKDASPEELAEAVHEVAAGRSFFSRRFRETLAREGAKALAVGKILSRREQQVLTHVLSGKTNREIADIIGISARTVDFHRANVMAKLGATNVTELFTNAHRHGLV
ncbi:MAG: response regulator transcription factor [Opitutae bacterium]|nr:response regulator transcription factor [Opitutae bacterium]